MSILKNNPFQIRPEDLQEVSVNQQGLVRRRQAYEIYLQTPMPTKKEHAWRKSPIDELNFEDYRFHFKSRKKEIAITPVELDNNDLRIECHGRNVDFTSQKDVENTGIIICSIQEAEGRYPELLTSIAGRIVPPQDGKFSALTQSLDAEGLLIYIPRAIRIQRTIHPVVFLDRLEPLNTFHVMIFLEEYSTASILLEWKGVQSSKKQLFAGVVEIRSEKGANLEMVELQTWSKSQWSILHERAELQEDSLLNWGIYSEGGRYARSFVGVKMAGANSKAKLTGICLNFRPAQIDFDTFQHHAAPATNSDLLFNQAVANDSRSVWTGMIRVEKNALKTDSFQANRNLILCGQPRIESIPGLEILTDDVRCSHGVSVGEIDFDQLYYLTTRGIPESEAKQIIARGFLISGLDRIINQNIRNKIEEKIQNRLAEVFCE